MRITQPEFEDLKSFVLRNRWNWPAVFSGNDKCEVWPFLTYGYTQESNRFHVHGLNKLLDELVMRYLSMRPEGGRMFIDERGVFQFEGGSPTRRVVAFSVGEVSDLVG